MTPQAGILGNSARTPQANSNIYNQVSSAGMASRDQADNSQEQPQLESLVDKATKRFGAVFNSFVDLTESYPGADKEADAVKNAMANWLNSIANRINESGANSTSYDQSQS